MINSFDYTPGNISTDPNTHLSIPLNVPSRWIDSVERIYWVMFMYCNKGEMPQNVGIDTKYLMQHLGKELVNTPWRELLDSKWIGDNKLKNKSVQKLLFQYQYYLKWIGDQEHDAITQYNWSGELPVSPSGLSKARWNRVIKQEQGQQSSQEIWKIIHYKHLGFGYIKYQLKRLCWSFRVECSKSIGLKASQYKQELEYIKQTVYKEFNVIKNGLATFLPQNYEWERKMSVSGRNVHLYILITIENTEKSRIDAYMRYLLFVAAQQNKNIGSEALIYSPNYTAKHQDEFLLLNEEAQKDRMARKVPMNNKKAIITDEDRKNGYIPRKDQQSATMEIKKLLTIQQQHHQQIINTSNALTSYTNNIQKYNAKHCPKFKANLGLSQFKTV